MDITVLDDEIAELARRTDHRTSVIWAMEFAEHWLQNIEKYRSGLTDRAR